MKNYKSIVLIALLAIFLGHLAFRIFSYYNEYSTKYDAVYWKSRYEKSQWNAQVGCGDFDPHINPKTCVWDDAWFQSKGKYNLDKKQESIGDDGLYAYAGWEYIHGKDPTLLNAEMPPLGKYLIGYSILLFGNQNIFAFLSGAIVLAGLFLLGKLILKDSLLAFIPVVLFSLEPLFYTQLRAPYLDLLYLSFLIFTFYFFLKNKFYLSSFFLGLMMATKASLATFGLVAISILIYLVIKKDKNSFIKWLVSLPLSMVVFLFSYSRYFLLGHNLIDFLKVQKWVISFYSSGAKGVFGSVFQMFLLGQWPTWFGKTVRVSEWSIIWPILFFLTLAFSIIQIRKRKLEISSLLIIWIAVYFVFLLTLPVFPRYFLVIVPFLYIVFVDFLKESRVKRLLKKI